MLYVTTRDDRDAYTTHRAMCEDIGPDGGRYVPFSLPVFDSDEISGLRDKSFSQTVADKLNLFFSSRLTGWDVDFCIGRNTLRLKQMNHRIIIAELWHNLEGKYAFVLNSLCKVVSGEHNAVVSDWMKIAVRVAILFGIYGELLRSGVTGQGTSFDVSVPSGDFSEPMAAYYARKMGLPIGSIICTCTDNSSVWDLLHRGTFSPVGTTEALQLGVERLIVDILGVSEVTRFNECCKKGHCYNLDEEQLLHINAGFFSTVAGDTRASATINSLYRTNNYVADPKTAVCFGGLQDYRSKTGESQTTLLLSEQTPLAFFDEIERIIGIDKIKLEKIVNY